MIVTCPLFALHYVRRIVSARSWGIVTCSPSTAWRMQFWYLLRQQGLLATNVPHCICFTTTAHLRSEWGSMTRRPRVVWLRQREMR